MARYWNPKVCSRKKRDKRPKTKNRIKPLSTFTLTTANIASWCDRIELPYALDTDSGHVHIPHPTNQEWVIRVIPREAQNMITFGLVVPYQVPEECLDELDRTVSRLNSRTFMGSWVLNHTARSIYFRVTLLSTETQYNDEGVLYILQTIFNTSNANAQLIRLVAQEGQTYEQARATVSES